MKVLLTGGGSGGHVSPALAVAEVLRQRSVADLLYIGGKLTMEGSTGPSIEEQLVTASGLPFQAIHAGKLARQTLGLRTIKRLWGVVPGCAEALAAVRRFSPDVVFSTGGYVSVPVVLAAAVLRIPIVVHEQTAAVGLANRVAGRLATKVAITFPQSASFFPKGKIVLTGNPLRPEVLDPDLSAFGQTALGQWLAGSVKPVLYVTGGGLGSHVINEAMFGLLPALLTEMRVVHQCGSNQYYADFDKAVARADDWPKDQRQDYWPVKSLTSVEVGGLYRSAQIVVARAGANTVLELAAWALPVIFVPIPWVTHDEQTRNARVLVEAGTAEILAEADLSSARLAELIQAMRQRLPLSESAGEQARKLVDRQAAAKLADLIEAVGRGGGR